MNGRRALAILLLALALTGIVLTRGALSPAQGLPVLVQIAIAVGAAICALTGAALWVKAGGKMHD